MKNSLGDRMKDYYENRSKHKLIRRMPVIIRLDGVGFSKFTRWFNKPFDDIIAECMYETTKYLCENIPGCDMAYTQSDEISLLLVDYNKLDSEAWYDYCSDKMESVSAGMAVLHFNRTLTKLVDKYERNNIYYKEFEGKEFKSERYKKYKADLKYIESIKKAVDKGALFDSRAFNVPKEDVCNMFIWRQKDAIRNSINSFGRSKFSSKQMHGCNTTVVKDMMIEEGLDFNALDINKQRGACVVRQLIENNGVTHKKWTVDKEIPLFTENRDYVERHVYVGE